MLLVDGQPWNPVLCCKYNGVWALMVGRDDATLHVGGEFSKAGGAWELTAAPDTWHQVGGAKAGNYAHLPGPAATTHPLSVANVDIGAGSGIVTSDVGGIACGTACDADLPPGTSVTLTAAPAAGYAFLGWGGDCEGTALACDLSMDGARHATASFGVPTYTVARDQGRGGIRQGHERHRRDQLRERVRGEHRDRIVGDCSPPRRSRARSSRAGQATARGPTSRACSRSTGPMR